MFSVSTEAYDPTISPLLNKKDPLHASSELTILLANNATLTVHRLIVLSRCKAIAAAFRPGMEGSQSKQEFDMSHEEVDNKTVFAFFYILYGYKVSFMSFSSLYALWLFADKYGYHKSAELQKHILAMLDHADIPNIIMALSHPQFLPALILHNLSTEKCREIAETTNDVTILRSVVAVLTYRIKPNKKSSSRRGQWEYDNEG